MRVVVERPWADESIALYINRRFRGPSLHKKQNSSNVREDRYHMFCERGVVEAMMSLHWSTPCPRTGMAVCGCAAAELPAYLLLLRFSIRKALLEAPQTMGGTAVQLRRNHGRMWGA